MRLKSYLALDGNSASKLAEAVGVAVSTITRAASGETLPTAATRTRIVKETGGEVSSADLFEEHEDYHVRKASDADLLASTGKESEISGQAVGA